MLQIGLADVDKNNVLDCLPQYSDVAVAPCFSENHIPTPPTWQQRIEKEKVRGYFTQDRKLNAKEVVTKLQQAGISKNTIFLSWSWKFDLSFLRKWLKQDGLRTFSPGMRMSDCFATSLGHRATC